MFFVIFPFYLFRFKRLYTADVDIDIYINWWTLKKVVLRIIKIKIKLPRVILSAKFKLQIFFLVIINFRKLTKQIGMEVIAEFTVSIIKLASLNMIFSSLIKFLVLLQKEHKIVYSHFAPLLSDVILHRCCLQRVGETCWRMNM